MVILIEIGRYAFCVALMIFIITQILSAERSIECARDVKTFLTLDAWLNGTQRSSDGIITSTQLYIAVTKKAIYKSMAILLILVLIWKYWLYEVVSASVISWTFLLCTLSLVLAASCLAYLMMWCNEVERQ